MATWRYEISLLALKEIFRVWVIFNTRREISYLRAVLLYRLFMETEVWLWIFGQTRPFYYIIDSSGSNSLSTHSKMRCMLWWTVSYKSLYIVIPYLELVRFFIAMRKRSIVFFRDNEKLFFTFHSPHLRRQYICYENKY